MSRAYVVGLPVIIEPMDDGEIRVSVDLSEVGEAITEDYKVPDAEIAAIEDIIGSGRVLNQGALSYRHLTTTITKEA